MIHSTLRVVTREHTQSPSISTQRGSHNSMNRRISVSSLRSSQRSTATITPSNNRHRPSTQTAQYVQSQLDYLPSTVLDTKRKEPSLYFRRGTVIEIISRDSSGWWHGQYENLRGWFPSYFVGRVSHLELDLDHCSENGIQKELDAWKVALLDQQKKKRLVSPSSDTLAKGATLRNRYNASTFTRQSMTPSSSSRPSSRASSSLMQQNRMETNSATTHTVSSVRKSRVPLPSPPSSACSSMMLEPKSSIPSSPVSSSSPSLHSESSPPASSLDWENRMDQVSKHMFDLVDACVSPNASSIHVKIHQTTSSIRALLACVPSSSTADDDNDEADESGDTMLAVQRKTVLQVLSRVVHKGSELQLTGCVDDARFRALVNQLWVEIVAFEEIIRTTFKPGQRKSNPQLKKRCSSSSVQYLANRRELYSVNTPTVTSTPTTPPNSPPRDPITPRSSSSESDQLVCGLLDYQRRIIDLVNTHLPYSNDLLRKDSHTIATRDAKDAVFDAVTHLIQVVRERNSISLTTTTKTNSSLQLVGEPQTDNDIPTVTETDLQYRLSTTSTTARSSIATDRSIVLPLSPLSPQQMDFSRLTQQQQEQKTRQETSPIAREGQATLVSVGRRRNVSLTTSNYYQKQRKEIAPVNKHSTVSANSDVLSSSPPVCSSVASANNSIRLSHSLEQLERPSSSISSSLLRKSSELFRSNRSSSQVNNISSISSTGSMFSDDSSQYCYDSHSNASNHVTVQPTPIVSSSISHRMLPRVTTLSNLAMRYLTSSTSTSTSNLSHRSSQPPQQHQHQQQSSQYSNHHYHQQLQSNAMLPPSPAASYTTAHVATPMHSLSPPTTACRDTKLLNSKSTPTFDQIKMSTSQSLRNMGVASLRNISRKQRRLSNQNRKSDSIVPPTSTSTATIATTATATSPSSSTLTSTPSTAGYPVNQTSIDPPLRLRISSSLRLRRSTDNSDQREKAVQEQKLLEEEEEKRNRPWYLKKTVTQNETIFNVEGHLVGASLRVLIDIMTCHEDCPDPLFIRAFFYNFRLFTDPETLATMLIKRFNLESPTHPETQEPLTTEEKELWETDVHVPVQLRVYNVIKSWFEAYFDASQDVKAAQMLFSFTKSDMEAAMPMPAKQMTELIELKLMISTSTEPDNKRADNDLVYPLERQTTQDNSVMISPATAAAPLPSNTASTPIRNAFRRALASHHHSSNSSSHYHHHHQQQLLLSQHQDIQSPSIVIHRMDPQEIANQLTLMESTLFCQIPPSELMATQKKKSAPAIHVKAMVNQSTLMVYWISNTILGEWDAKTRVMVIKFWIKVADACLQLNNFNTLMTIRCALNSASIARLRRTWDSVMRSTKYKIMYNNIDCVADSERNFAMYRRCLKNATPPGLPFLGIFLSDMVFIDEGNTDHRTSTNISSTTINSTEGTGHQQQQQQNNVIINFDKYVRMTQMLDQSITRFQHIPYYKLKEIKEIQRYLLDCIEAGNDSSEEAIYSKSLEIEPRIVDEIC